MRRRTTFWSLGIGVLVTMAIFARFFIAYVPTDYSPITNRKNSMNAPVLEFTLGEKGDDIVRRSNFRIDRSGVSSVLFYDASNVRFQLKHPTLGLLFPPASTVLFYDNARDNYGVDKVSMSIDLPDSPTFKGPQDPELTTYDRQAFKLISNLQSSIQSAGWKRFIMHSDPRLIGRITYYFKDGYLKQTCIKDLNLTSPFLADPDYRLTWNDWLNLTEGFTWHWYADNMILKFRYRPDSRRAGSTFLDSLNVQIQTAASLSGASHPNEATRTEYAESLMGALINRLEREEQARAAGLPILESYQDPTMVSGVPVPRMDSVAKAAALEKAQPAPPEPTLRKAAGELCPKSGWHCLPPASPP